MCDEKYVFDACVEWAKKSCEKNGLDAGVVSNLREQLGGSLYRIHFERMKFKDFASRNAEYEGLFSISELTNILQIIAHNQLESSLFTTKALSYEIFTWDDKRILECSLSDKLKSDNQYNVPEIDICTISCNKPLLLGKIKLARVNTLSKKITFGLSFNTEREHKIKIELIQKIGSKETSLQRQFQDFLVHLNNILNRQKAMMKNYFFNNICT